jgi:hypothetical protein
MRSFPTVALLTMLCMVAPAVASSARAVASASIVVPVTLTAVLADASPSVSIVRVRDGANEHVTVAFN